MGQYYMIAFMRKDGSVEVMHPHHYGNGLKLMEHSWVGNNYVNTVIQHLVDITKKEGGCRIPLKRERREIWDCQGLLSQNMPVMGRDI